MCTIASSGMTLPATPPLMPTALSPSRYTQPVDLDLARLVGGEDVENGCEVVDGVVPDPRARRVRAVPNVRTSTRRLPLQPPSMMRVGRLAQDREVALEQVGPDAREPTEPVEAASEPPRGRTRSRSRRSRAREFGRQLRAARRRPPSCRPSHGPTARRRDDLGRQVVVDRDRVDVPGDDHPPGATEARARDDRVAIAERPRGAASPTSAASIASAIAFSFPETDSMSQSCAVSSIEDRRQVEGSRALCGIRQL